MKKWMVMALSALTGMVWALEMPPVFSDNMVLQRDVPVRVWGSADPMSDVSVEFAGKKVEGKAGNDGLWRVELPALPANKDAQVLTVSDGKDTKSFQNILVGDVWLCIGQSNMQFGLNGIIGGKELKASAAEDGKYLRLLSLPRVWSAEPQKSINAAWKVCTPETASNFAAVGYLVGLRLNRELDVPVGLINGSWGGSRIEAWTTQAALHQVAGLEEVAKTVDGQVAEMRAKEPERKDKQRLPTVLFNAMINPLAPFAVRGMLYYQGEDNHYEGDIYEQKLQALAITWRTAFENADLPIYVVGIPPYKYDLKYPCRLPVFTAAQLRFTQKDKNAAFVVTTDCGNAEDIHPTDKVPLANRLSNLILYKEYQKGDDSVLSPLLKGVEYKQNVAVVSFDRPNGLKTADGQAPTFFEVAGADGNFAAAGAKIVGDTVEVSAPGVAEVKFVRFGWCNTAAPNLVNSVGVPAAPFTAAK